MASNAETTIDPREAEHFGSLAKQWWDPAGSSAMLHKLNPVRLRFVREAINTHWQCDPRDMRPLSGKRVLDVGCGAGLLCEPLARLGAAVTGIDAAPENIHAAREHAKNPELAINYRIGSVESLAPGEAFDLVTSMEVIEHVTDPAMFVGGLSAALAPGGLMVLSTPNRTALSRLAMIDIGEGIGLIPKGTHHWDRFLKPDELESLMEDAGLEVMERRGITFDARTGLKLGRNEALNYILSARHRSD